MSKHVANSKRTEIESLEAMVLMSATIQGTDAAEWLSGSEMDSIIQALGGNDEIYAPLSNNFVFGGAGDDAWVVYEGNTPQYEVLKYSDGVVQVTGPGLNGIQNINVLVDVERILFNDAAVQIASLPVTPGDSPTLPGDPTDPEPGVIGLETSVLSVNENAGTVDVNILRTAGSDGEITVDYQTFAATATAGVDYQAVSGTAVLADGQTVATVSVPILNDVLSEGSETFTFTIDNVTGGAALLVPRTAIITVIDDEAPSTTLFDFNNFANTTGLKLNGNAASAGNNLQLTDAVNYEVGSAYSLQPLVIDADTSFTTHFTFRIAGGTAGADGMAFVLQNDTDGSNALGTAGGALGYDGVSNSLAIEFDTYQNGTTDPNANHIDILCDGNTAAELASGNPTVDLNGGDALTAWVE